MSRRYDNLIALALTWQRARGDRGHVCSDTKDCLLKINSRNGAAKKAKSKHRHARRFDAVVLRRPGRPNTSRAPPDHPAPPPLSVRHVPISNQPAATAMRCNSSRRLKQSHHYSISFLFLQENKNNFTVLFLFLSVGFPFS